LITIEIRKFKDVDLKGGTIIEGFPGIGLVSSIVATYLIDYLDLDQICALDSDAFPPTSMIYASKPKFPARIYASSQYKIGVFLSEFTPPAVLHRPIARKLLEWCKEQRCKRIIATEGLPSKRFFKPGKDKQKLKTRVYDRGNPFTTRVYGIGSTERARRELTEASINQLNSGIIYGVAGVLLNEGQWENFDIITILADAHPEIPDAYSAAKIIEALDILLPQLQIDTTPLYQESKRVEERLRLLRLQAKSSGKDAQHDVMYY
jgi:uncharacterized protein